MTNQGQIIGQGPGSAYAFGSYINPNVPQAQFPAQPTVEPIGAPQGVPGINEYYQSISNLKSMVAEAKEKHGIDITKPDYTDPDRMALYNLYLQAQGKAAAMGAKLAKGATLEKELGDRIAKGQTVVGGDFSFNTPLTEAYVMQNSRFAGMPEEVTNINNQLGKSSQTVSAYRAAMKDYSAAKNMLQNRANQARKAGQFQEAAKYEDQMAMLTRPRLENIGERQIGLQERQYNAQSQSAKLKEDELNMGANTVSFALNSLERAFKTDKNGKVVIGRDGKPVTTQAAKDAVGMIVGASVPGKPNTEVLGASVTVHNGRPAIALRYNQYEDFSKSKTVGAKQDGFQDSKASKGRRALGPERGFVDYLYLDGESQGSAMTSVLNMINENRLKRKETAIGQDRLATDAVLNPSDRRNQALLTNEEAIIQAARKTGQPITAFNADIDNLARNIPGAQELIDFIQSADPSDPRRQEAINKYNQGLAGYRSYIASQLYNRTPFVKETKTYKTGK